MDAQDNKVNGAVNKENEHGASTKGNEDKKIFVGGIAYGEPRYLRPKTALGQVALSDIPN